MGLVILHPGQQSVQPIMLSLTEESLHPSENSILRVISGPAIITNLTHELHVCIISFFPF